MPRSLLPAAILITLTALTGACSVFGRSREASPAPAAGPAAASAAASAAPASALSDANIAAIVVAANNADISYAEQALAKSQDADVRSFATMVRADHQGVNRAATALVTRLKVTPVDNQLSFDLRDDAETKRLRLRDLEGFAFDSAYAANEVSYHRTVLDAIDKALIPSARNAELRALLIEVRPAVAAHLGHAEQLAAGKTRRR
ncbi:MAG: DUF4142 domain-containing protein [Gemmatimonadaceae bacterium]|nr:DUF4142 domain-containing protein [Gemmatimonadaceae bacterium]